MGKLVLVLALLFVGYLMFTRGTTRRTMSPSDARSLLGLSPDAGIDQVRDAHRRLIAKVHPDNGGSAELAARVNLARDTLVGELSKVA